MIGNWDSVLSNCVAAQNSNAVVVTNASKHVTLDTQCKLGQLPRVRLGRIGAWDACQLKSSVQGAQHWMLTHAETRTHATDTRTSQSPVEDLEQHSPRCRRASFNTQHCEVVCVGTESPSTAAAAAGTPNCWRLALKPARNRTTA